MTSIRCIGVVLAIFAIGCDRGPPVVRVEGKVLLDGQPLAAADVGFSPVGSGDVLAAGGRTRDDGTFVLSSRGARLGAGALLGEYVVTVRKIKEPPEEFTGIIEYIVPPRYGDTAKSPLRATVVSGRNVYEFAVESK